mgnify:CR=1 FL=1
MGIPVRMAIPVAATGTPAFAAPMGAAVRTGASGIPGAVTAGTTATVTRKDVIERMMQDTDAPNVKEALRQCMHVVEKA